MSRNSSTPSWILRDGVVLGVHDHPVGDGRGARGRKAAHAVDLDETHAAHADRLHPLVPAEARNVDPVLLRDLDQQFAGLRLHGDPVDRDRRGGLLLFGRGHALHPCAVTRFDLVAEVLVQARDRTHRRRAERADRGLHERRAGDPGRDVVADVEQQVEVFGTTLAVRHAVQDLFEPARALAARSALAARLVREELHETPRDEDRINRVVVDHDRTGAEHHAERLLHEIHVERRVEVLVAAGEPLRRRAAGDEELHRPVVADAAREPVEQVAERHAQLDFVVRGLLHVPRHREDACAGRAIHAELGVLLAAHLDDVRHGRQRLDVVHDRGLRVQALDRRERRANTGHAAFAFERFEQRGLFAADVRAGAAVYDDLEVEARALDVRAEETLRLGVGDSRVSTGRGRARTRRGDIRTPGCTGSRTPRSRCLRRVGADRAR